MSEFKAYRRKGLAYLRPVIKGEDLTGVSISAVDDQLRRNDPAAFDTGFVACNKDDPDDRWYVARRYFDDNFDPEPIEE